MPTPAIPTAALIANRSVKATGSGFPRGCDAARRIEGRKRHAMLDPDGRLLCPQFEPASVRDGATIASSTAFLRVASVAMPRRRARSA